MKNIFNIISIILLGTSFLTGCSNDKDSFVLRSDNHLSLDYNEQTTSFTICTNGEWNVTTNASWISFSKSEGAGDGTTREETLVKVTRNISSARTDSFILHAAGKDLAVVVDQEEGHPLTLGTATISPSLESGVSAEGTCIKIPYTYGYSGETVTLTPVLSGDAAIGLSVKSMTTTLASNSGTIEIPLSGTPVIPGELIINVSADDASITPVSLTTNVNARLIIDQHFDLMLWGSDIVAYKKGIKGGFMDGEGGKVIDPSVAVVACSATADGSYDLFSSMAPSYRELRGIATWTGSVVYEHPGYVKAGGGGKTGYVTTPAFGYVPVSGTVNVTCKVAQYYGESGGSLTINVSGGGTPSISEYEYQYPGTTKGSTWENVSFSISHVTTDTKITFGTKGNLRFCIDDIVVSE